MDDNLQSKSTDLHLNQLSKTFGKGKQSKLILDQTEISLKQGECTLLSGKNGSGKSTLMRILAGLIQADTINLNSTFSKVNKKQTQKYLRQHIMYLYQEPYMFDGSVTRNLSYALTGKDTANKIAQALKWADLEHRKHTEAKCLSGGEKQRLALAQAWLKQPPILLLDEPTANMDKHSKRRTGQLLSEFKSSGTTLLIASHDLDHLLHIMDRRLILENGKLISIEQTI